MVKIFGVYCFVDIRLTKKIGLLVILKMLFIYLMK